MGALAAFRLRLVIGRLGRRGQGEAKGFPRSLIPASSGGGRDAEQRRCVDDRESIPVDQTDQFGKVSVESVDGIPDLGTRIRGGSRSPRQLTPQAICKLRSACGTTIRVKQDVSGDAEQPHAGFVRLGRQSIHSGPRDRHGLRKRVRRVLALQATEEVPKQIIGRCS